MAQADLAGVQLWRRVPWKPAQIVFDDNEQRWRPSSAAFNDHPGGSAMSVDIAEGQSAEEALAGHPQTALAGFPADVVQQHGLTVERKALPDNPHHAEVVGKKTKGVRNAFAKAATWVVPPPDDWEDQAAQ